MLVLKNYKNYKKENYICEKKKRKRKIASFCMIQKKEKKLTVHYLYYIREGMSNDVLF